MKEFTTIRDLVIILSVSIPIIFLFKKLHLPSIVGFLLAGVIIGPYGFKFITELEQIEVMAEIGVILLLFTIGLEVSYDRLIKMKKLLLTAGGLQVLLTILFAGGLFIALGFPVKQSIYLGMLISLSSTAIVLTIFTSRNELEAPHGRIALSILIFQDLSIVPMFLLLPIFGEDRGASLVSILLQTLYAFGALAAILLIARFIMPKIIYHLANLRVREAFTIGVILLLLGTAYLTHSIGLSFALGAFIAGLILSESEFRYQIAAEILPFKDAFNSIFFVSIGLLLNIAFVLNNIYIMINITAAIIILKIAVIVLVVKLMKYPLRIAFLTGFALAQIGEFSFILAQAGLRSNILTSNFYFAFIASSIFTMFLTPFLLRLAPALSFLLGELEPAGEQRELKKKGMKNHVIIVGFGLNGRNLARVLKETGIPFVVIELNPETIREGTAKGENFIYGDSTKEEVLLHAGIKDANTIVFAISDPISTRSGLQLAKKLNPDIYSIVRTRYINEMDDLLKLKANEIIPEEFETSLQIFSKVLERFHIPLNIIMRQVSLLRGESYSLMRRETSDIQSFVHLNEILAAGLTDTYYIGEDNAHAGKSIKEINLRAKTDATIIAIVRGDKTISNPSGNELILPKDTIVITGTHNAVDQAFSMLDEG